MLKASSNFNSVNQVSSEFLKNRCCMADRCCVLFKEEGRKRRILTGSSTKSCRHQQQKLNIYQCFVMATASGTLGALWWIARGHLLIADNGWLINEEAAHTTIYPWGSRYEQLNARLHAHNHNVGVKLSRLCRSSMSVFLNPNKKHVSVESNVGINRQNKLSRHLSFLLSNKEKLEKW